MKKGNQKLFPRNLNIGITEEQHEFLVGFGSVKADVARLAIDRMGNLKSYWLIEKPEGKKR